jgi:hypothetical protein
MKPRPISIDQPEAISPGHERLSKTSATGPRSDAGKSRSGMNAVRRGIFASSVLVDGESAARYESLRRALMADLALSGVIECILVEKLTIIIWRHARFFRAEREDIFRSIEQAPESCTAAEIGGVDSGRDTVSQSSPKLENPRMFVPLAEIVERLMGYERHLGREIDRVLDQLERVRRMRLKGSDEFSGAPQSNKTSAE